MSSPAHWANLKDQILSISAEFNRAYKCLNKAQLPKAETQAKHLNNLVLQHNTIAATLRTFLPLLTPDHRKEVEDIFLQLKSKLSLILKKLEISDKVPSDLTSVLNLSFVEEDSDSSDTDPPLRETKMTPAEFLSTASKLLPDFDGSYENLQRFLDAISLVQAVSTDNEATAVVLIKSKLTGHVRKLITNETTIESIKTALITNIKGESQQAAMAKLANVKQNNKSANEYAKEVEALTKKLESAYISDGITPQVARQYATQTAVKTFAKNAKSEKVKLLMQAAQFSNLDQAVAKFIDLNTDNEEKRVNYVNSRGHQNSYRPNYRGNYTRGGYNRGNYSRGNYNRSNYPRGHRNGYNNRGGNNQSQRSNNANQSRNVRVIEAASENGAAPQFETLGNQL